ncbi:hypothetical protein [Streptomyces sp. NBC_01455]|uniref:hypothetical protein n=1 Tax=Streptomyces sp. NBC_01455 TaxID=2903874 RepID=UPI002E34B6EF|nr:hypothetical protein [Streptomyces sp. NBC_01455]
MSHSATNTFTSLAGPAVAAAGLNLAIWHTDLLAMAQGTPQKTLMVVWFLLGWGFGTGCMTALVIHTARRHFPPVLAMTAATVVSITLAFGVCAVMYGYLTDPMIMQAAMGGVGTPHTGGYHPPPGASDHMSAVDTVGLPVLLVPTFYAIVFAVLRDARLRPSP